MSADLSSSSLLIKHLNICQQQHDHHFLSLHVHSNPVFSCSPVRISQSVKQPSDSSSALWRLKPLSNIAHIQCHSISRLDDGHCGGSTSSSPPLPSTPNPRYTCFFIRLSNPLLNHEDSLTTRSHKYNCHSAAARTPSIFPYHTLLQPSCFAFPSQI